MAFEKEISTPFGVATYWRIATATINYKTNTIVASVEGHANEETRRSPENFAPLASHSFTVPMPEEDVLDLRSYLYSEIKKIEAKLPIEVTFSDADLV